MYQTFYANYWSYDAKYYQDSTYGLQRNHLPPKQFQSFRNMEDEERRKRKAIDMTNNSQQKRALKEDNSSLDTEDHYNKDLEDSYKVTPNGNGLPLSSNSYHGLFEQVTHTDRHTSPYKPYNSPVNHHSSEQQPLHIKTEPAESESFGIDSHYQPSPNFPSVSRRASGEEGPPTSTHVYAQNKNVERTLCQVCNDVAAGFHCGAYVCEACKKFFVRCQKQQSVKFTCQRNRDCVVTKETRTQCQSCRYQKCIQLGMYRPGQKGFLDAKISNIPCKVCGAPSSGYHFGAITCEGCKGFFRRTVRERDSCKYVCARNGRCTITTATRNMCKFCRYQKCRGVGMTPEGSRIGRQPNSVKHATMLELENLRSEGRTTAPSNAVADSTPGPLPTHPSLTQSISHLHTQHLPSPQQSIPPPAPYLPSPTQSTSVVQNLVPQPSILPRMAKDHSMTALSEILMTAYKELLVICNRDQMAVPVQPPGTPFTVVWQGVMKMFALHAQGVLRFAKKVPGFKDIHVEDQIVMVQFATYQIVMIMLAMDYNIERREYNYFNLSPSEKETMLTTFTPLRSLLMHFHKIGFDVKRLQLDDIEVAVLCAIVLITNVPENEFKTGKQIIETVSAIQHGFLHRYCESKFRNAELGLSRQNDMLSLLTDLKETNNQHRLAVHRIKEDHPELTFPQLYVEMFFTDDSASLPGAV